MPVLPIVVFVMLTYPGTKNGCFDHTRVDTRVSTVVVLVILVYIPGYQTWLFRSYSGRYPGINRGCFGHTRVNTRVPNLGISVIRG